MPLPVTAKASPPPVSRARSSLGPPPPRDPTLRDPTLPADGSPLRLPTALGLLWPSRRLAPRLGNARRAPSRSLRGRLRRRCSPSCSSAERRRTRSQGPAEGASKYASSSPSSSSSGRTKAHPSPGSLPPAPMAWPCAQIPSSREPSSNEASLGERSPRVPLPVVRPTTPCAAGTSRAQWDHSAQEDSVQATAPTTEKASKAEGPAGAASALASAR